MKQHVLLLDLKDNQALIKQYEGHHRNVWPEVLTHIKACGIETMRIYRRSNRLVMLIDVKDDFSWEKMRALSQNNPKVQAWENFMNQFQQPLSEAVSEEKWLVATQIFSTQKT